LLLEAARLVLIAAEARTVRAAKFYEAATSTAAAAAKLPVNFAARSFICAREGATTVNFRGAVKHGPGPRGDPAE
jgi:hypothetical protein